VRRREAAVFCGLASAAFMVAGALMRGGSDGWAVGVVAVVGGALLVAGTRSRIAAVLAVAAGLAGVPAAVEAHRSLHRLTCPEGSLCLFAPIVARHELWGADLAIAASVCLVVAAAAAAVLGDRTPVIRLPTAPPSATLALWLVAGLVVVWLFAFVLAGVAGAATLAALGMLLLGRGASALVRR
jgi:hypothetical protein